MANGNRSGSQKVLLVFAILALIAGIAAIIFGIMSFAGGMLIGLDSSEASATLGDGTITGADVAGMAGGVGIIIFVSGIFALLEGIFGIRAAGDATKATPFIVLAVISLVLAILSMLASSGIAASAVIGVIINAVCVWLGVKVKGEGTSYR